MHAQFAFGMLSLVGAILLGLPVCADQAPTDASMPSADVCAVVALAKFQQWSQPKLVIDQTNTYADGSQRGRELIVTPNVAYARYGNLWRTANVTRPQRGVSTPDALAKQMGLATCAKGDHVMEAGEQATAYTFTFTPDSNGVASKGTLWVSDATGLPLREEFEQNGRLPNSRVAKSIETTYNYNSDVAIPGAAELAESTRLFRNQKDLTNEQGSAAAGSGAQ